MEIKSLKMSYNVTYSDCVDGIIPPILEQCMMRHTEQMNPNEFVKIIQHTLSEWKEFIREFVFEEADEFALIRATEIFCS